MHQTPLRIRVIVERASDSVIGSINLKGPPNDVGDVEIGWGCPRGLAAKLGMVCTTEVRRGLPVWILTA